MGSINKKCLKPSHISDMLQIDDLQKKLAYSDDSEDRERMMKESTNSGYDDQEDDSGGGENDCVTNFLWEDINNYGTKIKYKNIFLEKVDQGILCRI